jgi:hypothetical protein
MITTTYEKIKGEIRTGDVIVFSFKMFGGKLSDVIDGIFSPNAGHIGTAIINPEESEPHVMHSVYTGLRIQPINTYKYHLLKAVWWLPIRDNLSEKTKSFDHIGFFEKYKDRAYDKEQVRKSIIDIPFLGKWFENDEDLDNLFCSEVVTLFMRESGIIPRDVNVSEFSPEETVGLPVFKNDYYLLEDLIQSKPMFKTRLWSFRKRKV